MKSKKIRRRLLSLILTALLVLGAVPQTALPVYAAGPTDPFTNVGTEAALRAAISANQNIRLTANITVSGSVLDLRSYQGIIDGAGSYILTAGSAFHDGIFIGGASTDLTLKDITIDGGGKTRAFYSDKGCKLTISGSTVQNCATETDQSASGMGGAIYMWGSSSAKGQVVITNSRILNNHTSQSTDASNSSNGGAIYVSNCDVDITGSSFEGNHCVTKGGGNSGGALWQEFGTLHVQGSTFKTGKGFNVGGAIYLANVSDARIGGNSSFSFDGLGFEAGVSGGCIGITGTTEITITESSFSAHNSAVSYVGGMIDIVNPNAAAAKISIEYCSFTRVSDSADTWANKNSDWNAYAGGAIAYEYGPVELKITGCDFIGCQAQGNVQGPSGGGAIAFGAKMGTAGGRAVAVIDGCTFSGCWTSTIHNPQVGGSIMVNAGNDVTIKNSRFIKGNVQTCFANYGGAIWNAGKTTLSDVKIQNLWTYWNGGGIYNAAGGEMTISGSNTEISGCKTGDGNNTNYNYGGGIYNAGTLNVDGGRISGNTAGAGDRNRQASDEYSGANIYCAADVTIGPNASFDAKDVRVLDGVSSIILSGAPSGTINVSVSETAKATDATHFEGMYRYIGYLVAKGGGGYSPTADDLAKITYLSRDADASADPEATGKWVFVYDAENKQIKLGQNATLVFSSNAENFNDPNASFAGSAAAETQTVGVYSADQKFTITDSEPVYENGSGFAGWYKTAPTKAQMKALAAGGSGAPEAYDFSETIIKSSDLNADGKVTGFIEGRTAYAGYLPFELSYEKGSVRGAANMPSPLKESYFGKDTVTVSSAVPTSEKSFSGWKASSSTAGTAFEGSYAPGASFTMPSANVVLTAQWDNYTLTYEPGLPAGKSLSDVSGFPSPASGEKSQGDVVAVPGLTMTGYTFNGWKVTADSSGTLLDGVYAAGSELTMPAGSVTLSAQWEINKHSISYSYTNTPDGAPAVPAEETGVEYGAEKAVAAAPSMTGWTFSGWAPSSGLSASDIDASGAFTMPDSDVVFTGTWTPNKYSISYLEGVPAGETVTGMPDPASSEHDYGSYVDVSTEQPSRRGYYFNGWKVTADASGSILGESYSGDGHDSSIIMPANDVELTAQWVIKKHAISYRYTGTVPQNAPGYRTNSEGMIWDKWDQEFGSSQSVAAAPSLTGWTFSGWTPESGISASDIDASGAFTMPDSDVVFTGSWTVNSYDVIYDANVPAGTELTNMPDSPQTYDYGDEVVVNKFPGRTGVTFLGWEVTEDESGALTGWTITPEASATFIMPANDVTLTGRWEVNTHSVSYLDGIPASAPAGASVSGMPDPAQTRHEYGTDVAIPGQAPILEGHSFAGWKVTSGRSADMDELYGAPGCDELFVMPDNDVELTAQWTINKHSISYEYTGGAPAGAPDAPEGVDEAEYGSVQTRAEAPYMTGHTFYGWTVIGLDEADIAADGSFSMPDNDVVFSGSWDVQSFSVSYEYEGEVPGGAPAVPPGYQAAYGSDQELADEPGLEGYSFSGWTPAEGLDASELSADGSFVMPAASVVFTGSWDANEYTVEYLGGEPAGFEAEGMPAQTMQTYAYGSNVAVETAPRLEGYVFTGWMVSYDGSASESFYGKLFSPGAGFSMPAGDLELTGQWKAGDDMLRFEPNPKAGQESLVSGSMEPVIGSTYSVATVSAIRFEYTGHFFTGWNTEADGSGDAYDEGGEYVLTPGDDVLYAQWQPETYTVSYVFEGTLPPKADELLPDEAGYDFGEKVKIEADPKASGYKFGGWTLAEDSAKPAIEYGSFEMPAGDVVFTGKWTKNASGGGGKLNTEQHIAYISGYPDGTVRPQDNITRAEVATIFFRLLKDSVRDGFLTRDNGFTDVPEDAWYASAVSTLTALGVINGYDEAGGRAFRPDEPITRAEFVAIAGRFDENGRRSDTAFSDTAEHWAYSDISKAAASGWVRGYADGSFKPDAKITRAETMAIVNRVLGRLPEKPEDLHKDMIVWTDNADESAWYYLDVQEASNSHEYSKSGSEKWTRIRTAPDWSRYER